MVGCFLCDRLFPRSPALSPLPHGNFPSTSHGRQPPLSPSLSDCLQNRNGCLRGGGAEAGGVKGSILCVQIHNLKPNKVSHILFNHKQSCAHLTRLRKGLLRARFGGGEIL